MEIKHPLSTKKRKPKKSIKISAALKSKRTSSQRRSRSQRCFEIEPPVLPRRPQEHPVPLGRYATCSLPQNCRPDHERLKHRIAGLYCQRRHDRTCRPGDCPLPQDCIADYSHRRSRGVALENCVSQESEKCEAPLELCKANLFLEPEGRIGCRCKCGKRKRRR